MCGKLCENTFPTTECSVLIDGDTSGFGDLVHRFCDTRSLGGLLVLVNFALETKLLALVLTHAVFADSSATLVTFFAEKSV